MIKISKNIRKLRTAKNLTQDELAKLLFVTRQTVSSWESGRTQPDIETLCKLADIFEVPAEVLIYGNKKKTSSAEKEHTAKLNLIIIFSVIASLFTAVGLILIFAAYWENFPVTLQTVFGFIPMVAGQAAAVFTFIKHRDSIAWREGASVLWCAGMVATIALIDSIYMMPTDFSDCLLIDTLLILPVIYILDAVTPLLFYYIAVIYYFVSDLGYTSPLPIIITAVLLFAAGLVYVIINRKKKDDVRHIFSLWISLLAGSGIFLITVIALDLSEVSVFTALTAFFLSIFILSRSESLTLPFMPVSLVGTTAMSLVSVILLDPERLYSPYGGYEISERISMIVISFLALAAVLIVGIVRRKDIGKRMLKAIFCVSAFVLLLSQTLCCSFFPDTNNSFVYLLTLLSAFAMAFTLIAEGVITNRFLMLNIGLISTTILLCYVIMSIVNISILGAGILLLFFGAVLFTFNFLLAKKVKSKKEENNDA